MKKRYLALPLMIAGAIFAQDSTPTQTNRQRPDPTERMEKMLTRMLQLDAAQQGQVHTILEEAKVVNQGAGTQMRDLHKNLVDAVKANDPAQIDAITQEIAAQQQQHAANRAKTAAKIYAILTESQRGVLGPGLGMLMGGFGPVGHGAFGPGVRGFAGRRGPGPGGPGGPPPAAAQQ